MTKLRFIFKKNLQRLIYREFICVDLSIAVPGRQATAPEKEAEFFRTVLTRGIVGAIGMICYKQRCLAK